VKLKKKSTKKNKKNKSTSLAHGLSFLIIGFVIFYFFMLLGYLNIINRAARLADKSGLP